MYKISREKGYESFYGHGDPIEEFRELPDFKYSYPYFREGWDKAEDEYNKEQRSIESGNFEFEVFSSGCPLLKEDVFCKISGACVKDNCGLWYAKNN